MRRTSFRTLLLATVLASGATVLLGAPTEAIAQDESGDNVAELIELVKSRPSGMDRDQWREARRDAARELGSLGDKRAVPVLMTIAEEEQFDAVGEIAIVSLGKLGDKQAISTLQAIVKDSSRDRYARKSARDALRKLGAKVEGDDEEDEDKDSGTSFSLATGEAKSSYQPKEAPDLATDLLAASNLLTLSLGGAHLSYDTVREESSFDGNASLRYQRIREHQNRAMIFEGRADVLAGAADLDRLDLNSTLASANVAGRAEIRFYAPETPWFGIGAASLQSGYDYVRVNPQGQDNTNSDSFFSAELGIGLGGGYGRRINTGETLRVRRLEKMLAKRKALGRPIASDLADRLVRTWWAHQSDLGFHDQLMATVSLLREAGVLVNEPDAGLTYAILKILEDPQLNQRFEGLQAQLAIGENVLFRDDDLNLEEGRIETLFSRVAYGMQNEEGNQELVVDGFARYRILADEDENDPSPWTALADAHWRKYHYGPNLDPLGALDIGVSLGASDDGFDNSELATRLGGSVGWIWLPNRLSSYRLAGNAVMETGELFLTVSLEGQFGFENSRYSGTAINTL